MPVKSSKNNKNFSNNWQRIRQNPQKLTAFRTRAQVISTLRDWFAQNNFLEVETPLMLSIPTTEPYYDLFQTEIKLFGESPRPAYLAPSPELQMKKLLTIPGCENIYQLGKCFRNQEGRNSQRHQTEFTMLEYYRTQATIFDLMTDLESMVLALAVKTRGQKNSINNNEEILNNFSYQNNFYNLKQPFRRLSVADAFDQYANLAPDDWLTEDALKKSAIAKGYQVYSDTTWEQLFDQILLNEIEPHLLAPTFLYHYPASQAALAKKCSDDPRFAERFEFWWAGLELANGYGELVDPIEQSKRCQEEIDLCAQLGKNEIKTYDHDFINALAYLYKTGFEYAGIAIGVDRLAMIMADTAEISDIVFFPTAEIFPEKNN